MNYVALEKAREEALRFLAVAGAVKTEPTKYGLAKGRPKVVNNTKESAACKRASLDLTRVLSELRKP